MFLFLLEGGPAPYVPTLSDRMNLWYDLGNLTVTLTEQAGPWLLAGIGVCAGLVLISRFIWRVIGKA